MSKKSDQKLIILSAPSGAGKTTLCQMLLDALPKKVQISISSTTRLPRDGEVNGVNYEFLSKAEFDERIKANDFAEWAEVHGNLYGTSKSTIETAFSNGKSVLLDIDVQGAESLRKAFPENCFSIFIAPPSIDELKNRLVVRGKDDAKTIEKRLENAQSEIERSKEFDLKIINDDLQDAFNRILTEVKKIIPGE